MKKNLDQLYILLGSYLKWTGFVLFRFVYQSIIEIYFQLKLLSLYFTLLNFRQFTFNNLTKQSRDQIFEVITWWIYSILYQINNFKITVKRLQKLSLRPQNRFWLMVTLNGVFSVKKIRFLCHGPNKTSSLRKKYF